MIRELVEVWSDPDGHERGKMSGQWHVAPAAKSLTDFPTRRIVILSQVERHGWADRRAQHSLQHLSRVWFQQQLLRRDNSKKLQCFTFLILFLQRCRFLVCNKVVRWKWNLKDFVTDFLYRRKRRIRLKYKHFRVKLSELPHPVYAYVFRIALRFQILVSIVIKELT